MTGGAVAGHGGGAVEVVPTDETAANQVGLADVTFAAGGVAGTAMVAEHFLYLWMVGRRAARVENGPVSFQVGVQVVLVEFDDVRMTIATAFLWVSAGIFDQASMGDCFVW